MYKYKNKLPCIKIFVELKDKINNNLYIKKKYIHGNYFLYANVRQLKASEQYKNGYSLEDNVIQVICNYREINTDMFIEFKGDTYQITGVDNLNFDKTEIKIIAKQINNKEYNGIIYDEY